MTRKSPVHRSPEIETRIIEGLEAGESVTSICKSDDMPNVQAFQRWCRQDPDFDDQVQRAWTRGMIIQLSVIHDRQEEVVTRLMNDPKVDPKTAHAAASILRDQNHNKVALLTRLDKRFVERQEINHTGPMVIGWDESCLNCGHNMKDVTPLEDDTAMAIGAPKELTGGEARR